MRRTGASAPSRSGARLQGRTSAYEVARLKRHDPRDMCDEFGDTVNHIGGAAGLPGGVQPHSRFVWVVNGLCAHASGPRTTKIASHGLYRSIGLP
jgi:hypothetical protein